MGNLFSSNEQEHPQTPHKLRQEQRTPSTSHMVSLYEDNSMTPSISLSRNYLDRQETQPLLLPSEPQDTDHIKTPEMLNKNGIMSTYPVDDMVKKLDFEHTKYLKYKAKYLSLKHNIVN